MLKIGFLVKPRSLSHLKIARNLAKILNAEIFNKLTKTDYHILIALDSTLSYLPDFIKLRLKRIKVAAYLHDIRSVSHTELTAWDAGRSPLNQRLRRFISFNLIRYLPDLFLSPTHAIAEVINKYTGVKPCVVHNCVDHGIYHPRDCMPRNKKVILTVATKKHIVLNSLAVFHRVKKILDNVTLVIRGPCPSIVSEIIDVICLPPLPETKLAELYSCADVFLYLSLHEGFALPVLEAMASGTPVIAFSEPSIEEIAGEAALLIKPKDLDEIVEATKTILLDEDLRNRLAKAGLERAKQFMCKRSAKELLNCLKCLE